MAETPKKWPTTRWRTSPDTRDSRIPVATSAALRPDERGAGVPAAPAGSGVIAPAGGAIAHRPEVPPVAQLVEARAVGAAPLEVVQRLVDRDVQPQGGEVAPAPRRVTLGDEGLLQ